MTKAQRLDTPTTHLIIAFDAALPPTEVNVLANKEKMGEIFNRAIRECIPAGKLDKRLDYVSLLNFGLGSKNKSLDDIAVPVYDGKEHPLVWMNYNGKSTFGVKNWIINVYERGHENLEGAPFSMITSSKPYSLKALKTDEDDHVANQTYLILVTDEFYNGLNNFENEFKYVKGAGSTLSQEEFYANCTEVTNLYHYNRIKEYPIGGNLKAIVFEVNYASVPSIGILDFPGDYNMHREQVGMVFDFDVAAMDDEFSVEAFEIDVRKADGSVVTARADEDGHVSLTIPYDKLDPDDIEVTSRAWLRAWDGVYNGVILSPYNTSPNARAERLSYTKSLKYEDEFKVFGMSMPSWLWLYPRDNAKAAALLLEILIIAFALGIILLTIYIINKSTLVYRPSDDEITLHPIGKD